MAAVLTGYFGDYATGTPTLREQETAVASAKSRPGEGAAECAVPSPDG
jgi:hypothetical protein